MNSARAAGVAVGRKSLDVRASDEEIQRAIDSQVLSHVKLPRNALERKAGELAKLAVWLLIAMGFLVFFCVDLLTAGGLFPQVSQLGALAAGTSALIFALLFIVAARAYWSTRRRSKAEQIADLRNLRIAAFEGARDELNRRLVREGIPLPRARYRDVARPDPIASGVTPRGAEALVAQWMRHLGESGAEVTQYQGDGGVDVSGARFIAQVKHFSGSVGVAPIRELAGVATFDGRQALFFTSSGYSAGAVTFANRSGVALFVYSAERAELRGINDRALTLMESGLG